tara:strand:- start:271 stop:531 length:261 start_codon:yes stop_codon:yes gene_type:complete
MSKRKTLRERGKIRFSEYFKSLETGERVAIKREQSVAASFPERVQGRTGVVTGKKGNSYIVDVMEFNKKKTFIIQPIHLKRIGVKK